MRSLHLLSKEVNDPPKRTAETAVQAHFAHGRIVIDQIIGFQLCAPSFTPRSVRDRCGKASRLKPLPYCVITSRREGSTCPEHLQNHDQTYAK